jgi:hypothetical protein
MAWHRRQPESEDADDVESGTCAWRVLEATSDAATIRRRRKPTEMTTRIFSR